MINKIKKINKRVKPYQVLSTISRTRWVLPTLLVEIGCYFQNRFNKLGQIFCLVTLLLLGSLWFSHPAFANVYTEEQIQAGNELTQKAFALTEQGKFAQAESYWTKLIEEFPENPAMWSNRGNAKVSQNQLESAIEDFNQAIILAPTATDPYLNRGTAWEGLGEWEKAIADYHQVLELDPNDAMGYNNLGNAHAGQRKWQEAIDYYQKATELAPNFAFARANYALALYEIGEIDKSLQILRNLVRKYPQFADVRAALTAVLWSRGKQGEAESNWVAALGLDPRYRNLTWLEVNRRWPPQMITALEKFLKLQ
ncbi:MAG: tetratricopeptide repeat protein [Coleofasciculaceae cyanobacterium SM2_1_6]|nr:tetratricopeptide repeat protein [Coleofasciculaceae cyanobacterium SM2_1_6]